MALTDSLPLRLVPDRYILADVLDHISRTDGEWQLKKVNKRKAFSQALYGVAKKLGHRSAYRDLELVHPSMGRVLPYHGEWIQVPQVKDVRLCYRVMLLGRESQKAATGTSAKDRLSGNTAMANQVQIDVRRMRDVLVSIDLTGPAFNNFCLDMEKGITGKKMMAYLRQKWGQSGTEYGIYTQNTARNSAEGYEIVRQHDGITKVILPGMGSVTALPHVSLGSHKQHTQIGQMMGAHRRG